MLQDGSAQRNRAELDDLCSPEPPQPAAHPARKIGDPFASGAASCVTFCVSAGLVTCLQAAGEYRLASRLPLLCDQARRCDDAQQQAARLFGAAMVR